MPEKKDLITAAQDGDRLETLIALRDLLASKLQTTQSTRDIAALSRRLMQAISEIELLEKQKQYERENPKSLYEFRRELNLIAAQKQTADKMTAIDREHENF